MGHLLRRQACRLRINLQSEGSRATPTPRCQEKISTFRSPAVGVPTVGVLVIHAGAKPVTGRQPAPRQAARAQVLQQNAAGSGRSLSGDTEFRARDHTLLIAARRGTAGPVKRFGFAQVQRAVATRARTAARMWSGSAGQASRTRDRSGSVGRAGAEASRGWFGLGCANPCANREEVSTEVPKSPGFTPTPRVS